MSALDVAKFRKRGYSVVRGVFSREEAEELREALVAETEAMHERGEAVIVDGKDGRALQMPGDALTHELPRRVLLHPNFIDVVRDAVEGRPAYWGDSSVTVGSYGGARAWHTDAYDTPISQGYDYRMTRCGVYLQDIEHFSGGLAVRGGSHVRRLKRIPLPLTPSPITLVKAEPGDVVVWDMRIAHAGEVIRFRPAPSLGLPLTVQGRLPESLRVPEQRRRCVMFLTFGQAGPDLDSWLKYISTRDYMQKIWAASHFSDSVREEAERAGLQLVSPFPEWGKGGGVPSSVSG